jgi:hypothetical protein
MGRRALAACLAALLLLLIAPAARATFHLIQIREVYPGSAANPAAEYVELQMFASGQNLVKGHFVRTYDGGGNETGTSAFSANVTRDANQSTLLLATPQAEEQFGIVADAPLSPAGQLSPAGGAVCWEAIDCVSWGTFGKTPPSPTGSPVVPAGIPDGMAIRRSIDRSCATALDSSDDTDNSAADFAVASPAPRPNSVVPAEQTCASGGGGGGSASPSGHAPQTTLLRHPPKRGSDRTATFRFRADEAGAKFECKLDGKAYRGCRSPFTTKRLSLGSHVFRVRARDPEGHRDPTPAIFRFKLVRP